MTTTPRQRQYAREKVFIARLQGRLVVGSCEEEASGDCLGVICGHHRNGYETEHSLDVVWLCSRHHTQEHARIRRAAKEATA